MKRIFFVRVVADIGPIVSSEQTLMDWLLDERFSARELLLSKDSDLGNGKLGSYILET